MEKEKWLETIATLVARCTRRRPRPRRLSLARRSSAVTAVANGMSSRSSGEAARVPRHITVELSPEEVELLLVAMATDDMWNSPAVLRFRMKLVDAIESQALGDQDG